MPEPITLTILTILGAIGLGLELIHVALLKLGDIIDWFRSRRINKNQLAFTVAKGMRDGRCKVIAGVFDTNTQDVKEAEGYIADDVDQKLRDAHEEDEVVIYK